VQFEAQGPEPLGNRDPQTAGSFLGIAVRDNIICITLKWAARELPVHPLVKRVVHEEVGQYG